VNQAVVRILDIILATTRAQVALCVKVGLKVAVRSGGHGVHANVELAAFVKKGFLEVLLNYVRAFSSVDHSLVNKGPNLIQIPAHLDATATVRVLARLNYPEAITKVRVLGQHSVAVRVVENFLEAHKLLIHITFFDMKRQRQIIKRVLAQGFVVALHVVVNCLLVRQVEVVFLVVARDYMVCSHIFDLCFFFLARLTVEATALHYVRVRARTGRDERTGLRCARGHTKLLAFKR